LTHLRLCIFFLGIAFLTFFRPAAEGQVSAYGMIAYSSYGFASQNQGYTFDNDTASIGGGAFYNFPIHSRLTAGIDGRVLYGPASHGGTTADAALRIGFVPTKVRFRPYFEIGGGVVSASIYPTQDYHNELQTGQSSSLLVSISASTNSVDWRVLEYGAGLGPSGAIMRVSSTSIAESSTIFGRQLQGTSQSPKPRNA
jgi:hypothetical protein